MAGRAAAPLPRSARSQPPALGAPLSLLLSPAHGGGGSSLLGSPAPVIRGAGLGGRSPRPPLPRHPGWRAPLQPQPGGSLSPTRSGKEMGTLTRQSRSCSSGKRGEGSLSPKGFEPMVAQRLLWSMCQESAMHGARTLGISRPGHPKPLLFFWTQFPSTNRRAWLLRVTSGLRSLKTFGTLHPKVQTYVLAPILHHFCKSASWRSPLRPPRHCPNLHQHLIHL